MAQYYGGVEERRQFEDANQERTEKLSDSDSGRESHQKYQGEDYGGESENVADSTKEGLSGANVGTRVEEGRGYGGTVDTNVQPSEGGSGSVNPEGYGDEKFSSDTGSNVVEDAGGFPEEVRESGENRYQKSGGDDSFIGGEKPSTDSDFGSKVSPEFGGSVFQDASDRLESGNEKDDGGGYENLRPGSGDASQLGYQVLGKTQEDRESNPERYGDDVDMASEKPSSDLKKTDDCERSYAASEEPCAKEESGRKQEVGVEGLNEASPYTQHDSKEDYDKRGYGGEGYPTDIDSNASGGAGMTEPEGPPIAVAETIERQNGSEKQSKVEKIKEKIVPGHKTEADQKEECVDSPKQKEGFIHKIKEKLTGKHGDTDSANYDQEYVADEHEDHKKKGVFEKIKEKLSPSPPPTPST